MALDIEHASLQDLIETATDVELGEARDSMLLHMEIVDRIKASHSA